MDKPTIVFLSTYPPRECGIATFTQDLLHAFQEFLGDSILCKVAAFNLTSSETYSYPDEVEWEIDQNNPTEYIQLAETVTIDSKISGIVLQHEYGIFGGEEGKHILTFMRLCKKPMLVTLHTTLPHPSEVMKEVTAEIIELATTVIVLTTSSKLLIEQLYPSSHSKIFVIPHGIHPVGFSLTTEAKTELELRKNPIISTFGLLSRGKGIEFVIKALPKVIASYPNIQYLVLGQTHPVVLRNEGEKYRFKLLRLIHTLGLEKHVRFYDQYLTLPELFRFLKATDIYISTSINPNQAVSGTLTYALGSGRAVISTEFAQAKELITPETGRLVPLENAGKISAALLDLLSDPARLEHMHLKAYESTRSLLWKNVARKYFSLLSRNTVPDMNIAHLRTMTDDFGLFQFSSFATPNPDFGYTLDDNARAAVVCSWLAKKSSTPELESLVRIYLNFINRCQSPTGAFINYLDFRHHLPTSQNNKEDLEEAEMRAFWAVSELMVNDKLPPETRGLAKSIFLLKLENMNSLSHLRAMAFAIKALVLAAPVLPDHLTELTTYITHFAESLSAAFTLHSKKKWRWFESNLSYNNGLLCEGLLVAGRFLKNEKYISAALESLEFLINKTFTPTMYKPIGQSTWYFQDQYRSEFDQQPEDPASMVQALGLAYSHTHKNEFKELAELCFNWFLGKNSLNISLYDKKTGGCYDGLHPDRVNLNQGAESLVSYLMSNIIVSQLA